MKTKTPPAFPLKVKKGSTIVKIYRTVDRGRDRFTLGYHEGSRRVLRQFADLGEARKEAGIVAAKLNAGQGSALELTGADRDSYLAAVDKLKSLKVPLNVAVEEYVKAKEVGVPLLAAAQFYKAKHHAKLTQKKVAEVVEEFIAAKKQDGMSLRYLSDCRSRMGRLGEDVRENIADIDTAALDAWLRGLDVKGRSRNNYRGLLLTLFRFARSRGYLPKGEATAADELQKAKEKSGATGIFPDHCFSRGSTLTRHGAGSAFHRPNQKRNCPMRPHNKASRLKRMVPLPLPESLERAFSEIERPAPRYAGAPERPANAPRTSQEGR